MNAKNILIPKDNNGGGHIQSRTNISASFLTVSAVVIIDRIAKIFFSDILTLGESIPVIRNIFHITLVHNTGIAFGLFKDRGIVFIIIPIVAVVLIVLHVLRHKEEGEFNRLDFFAFSLILGGAIGNLIDRIMFGYVIDFIDFRIWPVFNVADSAITVGISILFIKYIFLCSKQ